MRALLLSLLLLFGLRHAAAAAPAAGDDRGAARVAIELYTMGEGDDIFSRFGHAALCVVDREARSAAVIDREARSAAVIDREARSAAVIDREARSAAVINQGRCYNYGTADFSTPVPLTWDFIRGRARFWVSVQDLQRMVAAYVRADRTVYRQRLPLPPDQALALAAALDAGTAEDVRYYRYHHFHDNCTTRLRDHLDAVTFGRLRSGNQDPAGPTFRAYARRGFAGDLPLLIVADLLLGRAADLRTSRYQAMFLPEVLRAEVQARLHSAPEILHQRAPRPQGPLAQSTLLGRAALGLGGLGLALLLALSRRPATTRLLGALTTTLLGLIAVVLWALAALSAFPELRGNENLLVFWPSDVVAPLLRPRARRRYLGLRLCALALTAAATAAGLLQQPLWAALGLALPPLLSLWWQTRREVV